jgi:ferritin-like metal-binding protein YciE
LAHAFEYLEIGGYEQLVHVARRAADDETVATIEGILPQEREAAKRIAGAFDEAVAAALESQGVAT